MAAPGFVTASELQAATRRTSTRPTASSTRPTAQPAARESSTVQPAGDVSTSALAHTRRSEPRAEPPQVCMGTCGWSDPMKGFYPTHLRDGLEKLRFYARRFPCVEADTFTFAIPQPANVQKWAECTTSRWASCRAACAHCLRWAGGAIGSRSARLGLGAGARAGLDPGSGSGPLAYSSPLTTQGARLAGAAARGGARGAVGLLP